MISKNEKRQKIMKCAKKKFNAIELNETTKYGTHYSRIDQVKFAEGSL